MGKYRAPLANNDVIHLIEQNKEPEQKLWIAVLAKAFDDAFYTTDERAALEALSWIRHGIDFNFVCGLAGRNPEYVRKKMFDSYGRVDGCYQINHVKKVKQSWTYDNGNYYEYYHYVRTMLHNRAERLESLIKFAARKIEAQKEGVINYINS